MTITMLKAKIHRATVTQAELDYVGSITVDMDLLEQAGILEYEKVQIVDVNNGSRFETYTIAGERGSGVMCLTVRRHAWCRRRQDYSDGIRAGDTGGSIRASPDGAFRG